MPRSVLLRTVLPAALLLSAVLAAGCSPEVPHAGGPAGPVTAAPDPSVRPGPAAPAPPLPPSTGAASSTPTKSPPAAPGADQSTAGILGPFGFGALRLGMTDAQAAATGLITAWNTTGRCHIAHLKAGSGDGGGTVDSSEDTGVNAIFGISGMRTPEGIHVGSTKAQLVKTYPDWETDTAPHQDEHGNGFGYAAVPGNHRAWYLIFVKNGKVTALNLDLKNENCFN